MNRPLRSTKQNPTRDATWKKISTIDDRPPQDLAAGSYWISFYDPTNFAVPGYSTGGDLQYQIGAGDHGQAGAYQITGVAAVPEASELSLMLAGRGLRPKSRLRPAFFSATARW